MAGVKSGTSWLADAWPIRLSMLRKPALDPIHADSEWPVPSNPYRWQPYYLSLSFSGEEGYVALRHNRANNVSFADGHIQSLTYIEYTGEIRGKGDRHPQTLRSLTE